MSEVTDERIAYLEKELRVAQELLVLVLDHVGEPVVLDLEDSKKKLTGDRRIDLDLNTTDNTWIIQMVEESDEQ